jgi:LysM repeat protein
MGGIAFLYRVSLEDLMAANPGVMPNLMSVGTVLTIPPSKSSQTNPDVQPGTSQPPPTAVPL